MVENATGTEKRPDDLEKRTMRALTERMSVLDDDGGIHTVVGENDETYRVDAIEGRCTCPDYEYREARCKHIRRVEFAKGETPIPATVDVDAVDPLLGDHVEGRPVVAASDGGIIVADDEGGEILEDDDEDEGRPSDCECEEFHLETELPCWPCWREGYRSPADA